MSLLGYSYTPSSVPNFPKETNRSSSPSPAPPKRPSPQAPPLASPPPSAEPRLELSLVGDHLSSSLLIYSSRSGVKTYLPGRDSFSW